MLLVFCQQLIHEICVNKWSWLLIQINPLKWRSDFSLAAFLMLVRRHQKASFAKLLTESHLGCVQAFLDRKSGKWRDFSDDGHDLMRENRPQ